MEKEVVDLLKRLDVALDDWVVTYAPEFCSTEAIDKTRKRIVNGGGTLAYISDLNIEIRHILKENKNGS